MKKSIYTIVISLLCISMMNAQELLTNGDFETGTAAPWVITDAGLGTFEFHPTNGSASLCGGTTDQANATGGNFHVVTNQLGPGTHAIAQSFTVPVGATSVTLTYDTHLNNGGFAGETINPVGLDHTGGTNQHSRIDILTAGAAAFSTAPTDVVLNVATNGVDIVPYSLANTVDITASVTPGTTYQIRFASSDNAGCFAFGVDNVSIFAVAGPPPVIANDDADGDGTPDIADPCSCSDPMNPDPVTVMGPGGDQIFHELVTVTSGAGETWEMDATTVGALDATGTPLALPAAMTEVSPGVYTISFYHEINVGFTGDFSNGTTTLNIANTCTIPCSNVPTLGEWGLIVLTLLLLNLGILMVMRKRKKNKVALV